MKELPRYYPIFLILATAVILALPYIMSDRLDSETMIGSVSVMNADIAEDISNDLPDMGVNPYHHLLAWLQFFGGIVLVSKILPFALGIISVVLAYYVLMKYNDDGLLTLIICVMFIFSPIFIYIFTVSNPWSFFIVFLLLAFHLFHKTGFLRYLGYLVLLCLNLFGFFQSGLVLLIIALFTYRFKDRRKELLIFFIVNLIIAFLANLYYLFEYQRVDILQYFIEFLSIFGNVQSFGVFFIFLAFYGIIISWKKEYGNFPYTISVFLVFLLSVLFFTEFKIILNLVFSIFSGIGFYSLLKMKWRLPVVKRLTLFVLILGIVFSALSTVSTLSSFAPDEDMKIILRTLKGIEGPSVVLTHYKYGYWIKYYADKEPFTTENSFNSYSSHMKWNQSIGVFSSNSLDEIEMILSNNSIDYILLTEEMEPILIDEKLNPAFQFILENSNSFDDIRIRPDVQLWMYVPSE